MAKTKKIRKYKKKLQGLLISGKSKIEKVKSFLKGFLKIYAKKPLRNFLITISVLVLFMAAANYSRQEEFTDTVKKQPKEVKIFTIGSPQIIKAVGKINKSSVIKIYVQTSGIVRKIYKKEGSAVYKGNWLLSLSSNYSGYNIPSLSRQISEKQHEQTLNNFEIQSEIIRKREELAKNTDDMSSELRNISDKSINETSNLILLNEEIIKSIDKNIEVLESSNISGSNDALILQSKQAKSQSLQGLNSLKNALRNTQYQSSSDNEPATIAGLTKDITLGQIELERKALELNKEVAGLNLKISKAQEAQMYPSSPIDGTVQKLYISEGDYITSGTLLAVIAGKNSKITVESLLPQNYQERISKIESAYIIKNNERLEIIPQFLSSEPVSANLYSAIFNIKEESDISFADEETVDLELPLGFRDSSANFMFIPVDSVYRTRTGSFVYIAENTKENKYFVKSKEVVLGDVKGSLVEIIRGLETGDLLITDRNVIEKEQVIF